MKKRTHTIMPSALYIMGNWYFFCQFLYILVSATVQGSTFEFYLSTQYSTLPSPTSKEKLQKKGPIQIYQVAHMGSLVFFFGNFYIKVLLFQVAHLNFIFQHNAAPCPPPTREEKKLMEKNGPYKYAKSLAFFI